MLQGGPIHILLVEDDPDYARLVRQLLTQLDVREFVVAHAGSLAEARTYASLNQTDVVLLDLCLPDGRGLETVMQMQAAAPDTPIVVLTGENDEALAVEAIMMGAQDYQVKNATDSAVLVRSLRYAIERKRAEGALRVSEEQHRSLVQTAKDVIFTLSTDATITSLTPAFELITGWSRAEWVGKPFALLLHPDDVPFALRVFQRVIHGAMPGTFELRILAKSGQFLVGEFSVNSSCKDGTVVGAFVIARDIADRRMVERALQESVERFRLVALATRDAIYDWDLRRRTVWRNESYQRWFGLDEPVGADEKWWEEQIHPDDREAVLSGLGAALNGVGQYWVGEYRIRRVDGTYAFVHDRGYIVRDGTGIPIRMIGALTDVTERKRAEEALRQSEQQLLRVLEARERLAQNLHDHIIQTLYAIGLSVEEGQRLFEEGVTANASGRLAQAVVDLNGVIRDVRSYIAGVEPAIFSGSQLKAALSRLIRTMRASSSMRFTLAVDARALAQLTPEESHHVFLVAQEAMSNSLRHSKANGCSITLWKREHCVTLRIEDDGVGFDATATKELGQGLRNIAARAEKLGAHMDIMSEPGKGARVILDIPMESTHAATR